jgi:hypothetical protein
MRYVISQLAAWWHDVPRKVHRFWQPSYRQYGDGTYEGYKVRGFREPASVGDFVGLLQDKDVVHVYEVTKRSHGGGSDHIVSPYRYDFVYHGALQKEEFEKRQELKGGLLPIW